MAIPEAERQRVRARAAVREPVRGRIPRRRLLRVASVACGIQFGWALQLSLLTPYVQELGIPHAWASVIWLCGPLSGFLVQPLVGHMSDRSTSRFGRRRPFILAGATAIIIAVLVIGFSADIGWLFGDRGGTKKRAVVAFVIGFWLLDVANNMTQGPCRALLADLTGKDHRRTRVANAYFSLFMAVGNVLGFATGAFSNWYKIFPFTVTSSCNVNCANLKSAFILDIVFIAITTYVSISAANELPLNSNNGSAPEERLEQSSHAEEAFLWELFGTFRYLTGPIWVILLVTSLTWIGWFPFLLFDTDWMGREIYRGKPNEGQSYHVGVRMGSFGLMLNSLVLGITSVLMEKLCRKLGAGVVWGISNILMSFCFVSMLILSYIVSNMDFEPDDLPPNGVVIAALIVFAILGIPLAITYSVPYALISTRIESLGLGQGLSMGVLNLAIVVPQVVVSVGSGPLDQLFGGGNSPSLAVAAVAAFASGLVAILAIPRSRSDKSGSHH
ncbi:sucrose transport protein SUC4 [Cornus florida]|uniref:sucrose transport protein SUC4 n=1 Tax=Cornus florida TaxID=4283 RepID=UPI00289C27B9|nr:sucrose transport protein SUC4 [Cornus florida]XP_059631206.1 sucrose transport protein SUC4 [Cornus florida]XP_059631207.1 sucrose transport protein SUC4 [Cornus florida]